ncbi:MAG: hypothetical protein R3220_09160 [Balneolaceae bacterium]|nr:hypothetical protein [Balneolaceae bacterium]
MFTNTPLSSYQPTSALEQSSERSLAAELYAATSVGDGGSLI